MKRRRFHLWPSRRRLLFWCVALAALPAAYWLWTPGLDVRDGRHDRASNGIWLQHGWLGDDAWFDRNKKDSGKFRSAKPLADLVAALQSHHMRYVYPHLCPAQPSGDVAGFDAAQMERFLDAMEIAHIAVLPWVGGIRGDSAKIVDGAWRKRFELSCVRLLADHPRLAGVHVNIEPLPSGDADFLLLLEELRHALPPAKCLSVAAYPPPTRWQPSVEVHWDESYSKLVSLHADQIVVMMYDTSLHSAKLYEQLMRGWTRQILDWYAPKEVLLGVPAYEDAGVGYHDPSVENLQHAFNGIHAGLNDSAAPPHYAGVCVYCEWEMTPDKWKVLEDRFLKAPR